MNKPERLTSAVAAAEFQVGGVIMRRPFRIRRPGHFGVNVANPEKSKDFYCRLLGFRVSDPIDFRPRLPEDKRAGVGTTVGYFSRHGTDHHSFVFFSQGRLRGAQPAFAEALGTLNQITWQVGSLQEVSTRSTGSRGGASRSAARAADLPGSNWHFYPPDPTATPTSSITESSRSAGRVFEAARDVRRALHQAAAAPAPVRIRRGDAGDQGRNRHRGRFARERHGRPRDL